MTTSHIVIKINNAACDFLKSGYHQEAYRLLKKALQILQLVECSKGESASTTFVQDNVLEYLQNIKGQCVLLRPTLSSHSNGLAMYQQPFKIPKYHDTTAYEQLSLENIVRVIYNFALSMHL